MNLSKAGKVTRVLNGAVSGTGVSTSTAIDMTGFSAAAFYLAVGAIGSGSPLGSVAAKVQQSAGESPMVWTDLDGAAVVYGNTADNKVAVIEVDQPSKRYLRLHVTRSGGASVLDGAIAIQHKANAEPVEHDSTVVEPVYRLSPAEV